MFDRFVRLTQARKALQSGQFERALQLAEDPLIADHRRTAELRAAALEGLMKRARKRAEHGGLVAALADVSQVIAFRKDFDGAGSLRSELQDRMSRAGDAAKAARKLLDEARGVAELGDLAAAAELARSALQACPEAADFDGFSKFIEGRRRTAAELLSRASDELKQGDGASAREHLGRARALDHTVGGAVPLAKKLASRLAKDLEVELKNMSKQGDVTAVVARFDLESAALPELVEVPALVRIVDHLCEREHARIRKVMEAGDLDQALDLFAELDSRVQSSAPLRKLAAAMPSLQGAKGLIRSGNFQAAAESYRMIAADLGVKALEKEAVRLDREASAVAAVLEGARKHAAEGRLVEAREELLSLLERMPSHQAVRREMDILDQGAMDREARMAQARSLVKDGGLREAASLLVSLAVTGPQGDEARLLLRDIQNRMDLVNHGLNQILRAVHGQASASVEGLSHCIHRIEELEKVQVDSDELHRLREGLKAEIRGLECLEGASRAIGVADQKQLASCLSGYQSIRSSLIDPDRLAAREQTLCDAVMARSDEAIRSGRLRQGSQLLAVLESSFEECRGVQARVKQAQARISALESEALQAAHLGSEALRARDLDRAEEHLAAAKAAWSEGSEVMRLDASLHELRERETRLENVEAFADQRDFSAAQRELAEMGPTPELLRTRIFDLKKNLARSQGLEGAFLLRVDEGGEFLVMRSDSITIGNVRDGKSDLPILANLAGCHARIQRSLSFHGGMQDSIRAERGELFCAGSGVREQKFRSGMRVRLGPSLELAYALPSKRSLTSALTIKGGFQVGGTDKVLLMKDRGRDGRILIGAAKDAHICVPGADEEVEIFANKDGQIRVRCKAGGEMDGRPFSGEHPITAGAMLSCAGVTFTLHPWSHA